MIMVQITRLQGTARVINYAGLVRGATQRMVKLEITGSQSDELIKYLDDILSGLRYQDTIVEPTVCIMFDLNNLKFHNDHFGHNFGDKYIKDAAVIIKKVFQKYGKIYRIGGDEFCILIDSRVWCPVDRLLLDMQDMQDAYNEKTQVVHMQIAYGYAWFDENQDQDLEHTRNRADKRMYENKDKQKANDSWIKTRRV